MSETLVREALLEYRRDLLGMIGCDLADMAARDTSVDNTYVIERVSYLREVDAILASQRHIDSLVTRLEKK